MRLKPTDSHGSSTEATVSIVHHEVRSPEEGLAPRNLFPGLSSALKIAPSVAVQNEVVSNHDELMCNFFAQADALANGKSAIELRAEQVPDYLVPHRTFTGNRPSLSVLLPDLTAYTIGQLLSLYENRVAVQVSPLPCMAPVPSLCSSQARGAAQRGLCTKIQSYRRGPCPHW